MRSRPSTCASALAASVLPTPGAPSSSSGLPSARARKAAVLRTLAGDVGGLAQCRSERFRRFETVGRTGRTLRGRADRSYRRGAGFPPPMERSILASTPRSRPAPAHSPQPSRRCQALAHRRASPGRCARSSPEASRRVGVSWRVRGAPWVQHSTIETKQHGQLTTAGGFRARRRCHSTPDPSSRIRPGNNAPNAVDRGSGWVASSPRHLPASRESAVRRCRSRLSACQSTSAIRMKRRAADAPPRPARWCRGRRAETSISTSYAIPPAREKAISAGRHLAEDFAIMPAGSQ